MTTQSYSPTRGWIENIHTVKDTTVHQDLTYEYYADGMIESVTSAKPMESWTYAYDDLNRLLTATNVDTPALNQTFQYDELGNITYNSQIGTYTYPSAGNPRPHAVSTAGSRSYSYDIVVSLGDWDIPIDGNVLGSEACMVAASQDPHSDLNWFPGSCMKIGMVAGPGGLGGDIVIGAADAATFFEGASYTPKVVTQMEWASDVFHTFPAAADGYAAAWGEATLRVGADGTVYTWLELEGGLGGYEGVFQYIKDMFGYINHRMFIPF